MMPAMSKRSICLTGFILCGALAIDGATTHISAAALRALLVCLCIASWPRKQISIHAAVLIPVLIAISATLWGLTISDNPGLGIQSTVTAIIICGLFISLTHSETNTTSTLLQLICGVAFIHATMAICLWALEPGVRASGYFANPNNLAAWLAPCSLISLHFFVRSPSSKLPLLICVVCATSVFVSQSRSGILALILGGACFLAISGKFKKYGLALLGLLAVGTLALLYDRITGAGDPLAFSRLSIWKNSLAVAFAHPEGVGIAGYGQAMRMHGVALEGLVHYPRFAEQAHNVILHGWVEAGFLGLAAIISSLATAWLAVLKSGQSWTERFPYIGVLLSFLIPAFFSTTFHVVIIIATATIWCAFIFRLSFNPEPFGEDKSWDHVHASIAALGIVLICFLIPGILSRHYQDEAGQFSHANNLARAKSSAEQAVNCAPFSVGARLLLESLKFRQGEGPIPIAERLLELGDLYPNDHRPVQRAASLLAHAANQSKSQGLWTKTAAIGMAGLNRNPHDCLSRVPLGRALYRSGQHLKARSFLEETLKLEPHCAGAHANLAQMYRIANQMPQAIQYAKRALEADAQSETMIAREKQILSLPPVTKKLLETLVDGTP